MSELQRFNVLITRPENQQQELTEALESKGATCVAKPLIKISCVESDAAKQAIISKIQQLDAYRFLIFVSSNAAAMGADWIDQYWPQFPLGVEVIALGPATSAVLQKELGCRVTIPTTGITSEDVLGLAQLQELAEIKVAIFRGNGGRELLAETLRGRGAKVDYIEVYERSNQAYEPDEFVADLKAQGINAVSTNSVETIKSYISCLGNHSDEFKTVPLLVPSARVAAEATQLGFTEVIDCVGADPSSIVAGLEQLADIHR